MKKLFSVIVSLFTSAGLSLAQGPPLPPPPPNPAISLDVIVCVLILVGIVYGGYKLRFSKTEKA